MTGPAIIEAIQKKFSSDCIEAKTDIAQPWVLVKSERILEVARFLKNSPELSFDFLRLIAGVDLKDSLEVVYSLFSYAHEHEITVRCRVTRESPNLSSVASVWSAADWHEREAYDLVGVVFDGHPDLRRLLLPDDWEGHPLRKDYKEKDQYNGVSTTRPYLTGMPDLPTLPVVPSDGAKA